MSDASVGDCPIVNHKTVKTQLTEWRICEYLQSDGMSDEMSDTGQWERLHVKANSLCSGIHQTRDLYGTYLYTGNSICLAHPQHVRYSIGTAAAC